MKNSKLKSSALVLSIVIGSTPVMACTTMPRANTSRSNQFALEVSATATEATTEAAASAGGAEAKPAEKTEAKPAEKTEAKPEKTEAKPAEKTEAKPEKPAKVEKTEDKAEKPAEKPAKKDKCDKKEEGKVDAEAAPQGTFTIDNFQVIQKALDKLGVDAEELEKQVKEGKKLVQVLEDAEIPVNKFKKQLYKEYCAAIKEGVKAEKLTKEEAKVLKKAIKEKVNAWMAEEK
ncbi:MAG: hypothetical protein ATN35_10120 [Epulopiscium sp. Nele67-Bin004]|nr:MAG: hypothetical protein ATN35_10120 [Epulopiscium sp. Nele67-Bin004]